MKTLRWPGVKLWYTNGPVPTGLAGLKPSGAMYRLYQNAASCSAKLEKGLVSRTRTVWGSRALVFARSIGPRPNFPVKSLE